MSRFNSDSNEQLIINAVAPKPAGQKLSILGLVIDLTMGVKMMGGLALAYEALQFYYATLVTENLFLYLIEVVMDGTIFAIVLLDNIFIYN